MDIKETLRAYLRKAFGDKAEHLADDVNIFEQGYVNSMFALQLVTFMEGNFGLTVDNEDLDLANFSTLAGMEAFVNRKTGKA